MNLLRHTLSLLFTLSVLGIYSITMAQESEGTEKSRNQASIELKATEITESLNNIIGSFRLQEMEIVGSRDQPQFNYILRWKDPVPFPEEGDTFSRALIDPHFTPLDSEGYRELIEITTE